MLKEMALRGDKGHAVHSPDLPPAFAEAAKGKLLDDASAPEKSLAHAARESLAGAIDSAKLKAEHAAHTPKTTDEALIRKFESQANYVVGRMRHVRLSQGIDHFIERIAKPCILLFGGLSAATALLVGVATSTSTSSLAQFSVWAGAAIGIAALAGIAYASCKPAFELITGANPFSAAYQVLLKDDAKKADAFPPPHVRFRVPFTRRYWAPVRGGYWNMANANEEMRLAIVQFLPTLDKTLEKARTYFSEEQVKHAVEPLVKMRSTLDAQIAKAGDGENDHVIELDENELFEPVRALAHAFKDRWNPELVELREREAHRLAHAHKQ